MTNYYWADDDAGNKSARWGGPEDRVKTGRDCGDGQQCTCSQAFSRVMLGLLLGSIPALNYYKSTHTHHNMKPLLLLIPLCLSLLQPSLSLQLGWGLYTWLDNQLPLYQPLTPHQLTLSHPQHPNLALIITTAQKLQQQYNNYNSSVYRVGEGTINVRQHGLGVGVEIGNVGGFKVGVRCGGEGCREAQTRLNQQLAKDKLVKKLCVLEQQVYNCKATNKSINLALSLGTQKSEVPSPEQANTYSSQSLTNFFAAHSITRTALVEQIVESALSELMNSICLYPYEGRHYAGLCDAGREGLWEYNFKLAPFSIYLLADYYEELAKAIYRDYFQLFQAKFLYPINETISYYPFPQHLDLFTRFDSILNLQDEVELLNSLFVAPMLNELGTLHEQLNYREAKKLHPLLIKMLSQKWLPTSPLQSIKSLYEQSFTEDFKHHEYGQKLEQSHAKIAYLYKVVDLYTMLLIKHHAFYMDTEQIKEHLQEHFTLKNLLSFFINDDESVKKGKYLDHIGMEDGERMYARYFGYGSLLVYTYGLGKVYPEYAVKGLQSPFGIKSSNQPYDDDYRYRGDIHGYFNYKIITGILSRVDGDKELAEDSKRQIREYWGKKLTAIGNKIKQDYAKGRKIYTSWSPEGQGRESIGWLKIVSALFIKWI